MKKSRSRLFRARAVCEAYTSFPRGAHPRGAFYVIRISYHIMNRLSATGFAHCDEQPGCPRSRFSPSITSPRWRALSPASAGCPFSNGTRKTNAAFSVACFSFVLALLSFDHEPALARSTACFAGCSFSNGTRKTNAAFSVACFSFVLII